MNFLPVRPQFLFRPLRMGLTVAASLVFASSACADELITLKTRPGVTQSVLLWEPHGPTPNTVILLIPGGSGNISLAVKDGRAQAQRPHLFSNQREALLQEQFAVAVIDAPSDQEEMTQDFRMSAQHATDMQAAVHEIRTRFPKARLVLMGHSRGTVSVGHIAPKVSNQINAIVLLSGLYQAGQASAHVSSGGPGLSKIDLPALKVPILLVHHADDACPIAPMAATADVSKRLPMITVTGGTTVDGGPLCGPGGGHWFAGMEKAVGQEVLNWLSGKAWKPALP